MTDLASFSTLTPDIVLDALSSIGWESDGRLLALHSYENRVYQVGMERARPLIAKFYRPARWHDEAILEEHHLVQELVAHEIPVVAAWANTNAQTLHSFAGFRFAVFACQGGRAPELEVLTTLEWLGRFLGRIHAVGKVRPYWHRPTLDIASFGNEPSAYLLKHGFIPADLEAAYRSTVSLALQGVQRCFERAGEMHTIRLHGDCHAGNILWTEAGPHFVDFDDSRMGPAVQDLWMLLSGNQDEMTRQMKALLRGYTDFCDFNTHELHLVEALRTLRLIHYSAWLAQRWDDPAFPIAFPWFNTQRYWQDRVLELREQIALMDETPFWSF